MSLRVGSSGQRTQVTAEVMTLWMLVALELLTHVGLRHYYRRHHGG